MSISEQVDHDIKDAMRAKQADRLSVLRLLKAAIKNAALEKGGQAGVLDDAEATAVIRKQVKQRQDSVESFEQGGRPNWPKRSGGKLPPSKPTSRKPSRPSRLTPTSPRPSRKPAPAPRPRWAWS